jgi:hypothetical protein
MTLTCTTYNNQQQGIIFNTEFQKVKHRHEDSDTYILHFLSILTFSSKNPQNMNMKCDNFLKTDHLCAPHHCQ